MIILGIDPSGNFNHGKGKTGICIMKHTNDKLEYIQDASVIDNSSFKNKEDMFKGYFNFFNNLINKFKIDVVVIERYVVYSGVAEKLTGEELETSEIIGHISSIFNNSKIEIVKQLAVEIKAGLCPNYKKGLLGLYNLKDWGYVTSTNDKNWYLTDKTGTQLLTKERHILNALQHILKYAIKNELKIE